MSSESPKLPPGTPDFLGLARAYWQTTDSASTTDSPRHGSAVLATTPDASKSMLEAFAAALDTPVIQKVVWPETVPANHPIRSMPVHVQLWTGPQWNKFWELSEPVLLPGATKVGQAAEDQIDQNATSALLHQQFWFVVLISACDNFGSSLFPNLLSNDPSKFTAAGCGVMKEKYGGPAGLLTMTPIYNAALSFNGLLKSAERDGKNSDPTTGSTSSGE